MKLGSIPRGYVVKKDGEYAQVLEQHDATTDVLFADGELVTLPSDTLVGPVASLMEAAFRYCKHMQNSTPPAPPP